MCAFTNEQFQLKVTRITGNTELLSEQLNEIGKISRLYIGRVAAYFLISFFADHIVVQFLTL